MTNYIFGRLMVAGLLSGIALPATAQVAPPPPIVETAPLAPVIDPADTEDFANRIEPLLAQPDRSEGAIEAPGDDLTAQQPPVDVAPGALPAEMAPPVVPSDPIALALADELSAAAGTARDFVGKRREAAVESFYETRMNAPAWVDDAGVTDQAVAVIQRLSLADTDGLDPAALGIPAAPTGRAPHDLARFDIALSRAVVAFSDEASAGRIAPSSISSKYITRKPERLDPIESLQSVVSAVDVAKAMEAFNPPHDGFRRLKVKLAEVRREVAEPAPEPIPDGRSLRPGMVDVRVTMLRERLGQPAEADPATVDVYDDGLVTAVKDFQSGAGLVADGIIGPRTLAVLNGADRDEEGEIIANMEMWRWMPRDLGTDYVFVNIPEFMVRVVRHGVMTHETRVVVGTPSNQTPIFSDEMEYLVVNPYWHVPESIRLKEMLPEIKADPAGYFRRHGYEAVWEGQVIDPSRVLWDENAIKYVAIRQPPSEANALGRIKFMFPNQHAVYLHDTPSRKLFTRDYRAYSHGCVRVDDPMRFAGAILESEPNLTVGTLESMFGGTERRVDLSQRLKVHIAYFTAWVDENGTLQMRDDLYGHTGRVKKALEKLEAASL